MSCHFVFVLRDNSLERTLTAEKGDKKAKYYAPMTQYYYTC
jgi:hypothetical protein